MSDKKKTLPVYVLGPLLLASLGLNVAQSDLIGDAKATQEVVKQVTVDIEITGAGAIATFDNFVGARACPLVDEAKSLTGDDVCDLDFHKLCFIFCFRSSNMDAVDLATGGGTIAVVMGLIEIIKGQLAKRRNGKGDNNGKICKLLEKLIDRVEAMTDLAKDSRRDSQSLSAAMGRVETKLDRGG